MIFCINFLIRRIVKLGVKKVKRLIIWDGGSISVRAAWMMVVSLSAGDRHQQPAKSLFSSIEGALAWSYDRASYPRIGWSQSRRRRGGRWTQYKIPPLLGPPEARWKRWFCSVHVQYHTPLLGTTGTWKILLVGSTYMYSCSTFKLQVVSVLSSV